MSSVARRAHPRGAQPSRLAFAAWSLWFVGALAACGGGGAARIDGLALPVDAPGPFAVGYRELSLTYDPPDGGPPRTIPVVMWYPADAEVVAALEAPVRPTYLYLESLLATVDAPPAPPAYPGGYPVIVHSHGHWAVENHSYWIGEGLAALGFVVIAPGHIGDRIFDINTMVDDLDDRYERVYDVSETLDLLEELPPSDPFHGLCNTERVIISGHSRGSFTVWAALGAPIDLDYIDTRCAAGDYDQATGCPANKRAVYETALRDPRIVAGIPMAGSGDHYFFGGYPGLDAVTAPVMHLTASADPVGVAEIMQNVTTPPMFWVEFEGGCHDLFGFGICGEGVIDNAIAQPAIRTYVYAFARRHLFDDADPVTAAILDGSREVASIARHQAQ